MKLTVNVSPIVRRNALIQHILNKGDMDTPMHEARYWARVYRVQFWSYR